MLPAAIRRTVTAATFLGLAACAKERAMEAPTKPAIDSAAYAAQTTDFHAKRLEAIAGPDGWVTLAGLFWLDSASYTIGSARQSSIKLPADHTPATLGTLSIAGKAVTFRAATGARVTG